MSACNTLARAWTYQTEIIAWQRCDPAWRETSKQSPPLTQTTPQAAFFVPDCETQTLPIHHHNFFRLLEGTARVSDNDHRRAVGSYRGKVRRS
jgi:hypothetical protein